MKRVTTLYMDPAGGPPPKARGALTIAAGKLLSVRVPLGSSEGWLTDLVVKQVSAGNGGGTSVGFSVDLVESALVYHQGLAQDQVQAAYNVATGATPELFRVLDQQTATAGNAVNFKTPEFGYSWINQDQPTTTANQRVLYLAIIPNNSVDSSKWEVMITILKDIDS